jgi:hypothetical protein
MRIKLIRPGTDVENHDGVKMHVTQAAILGSELCVQYQVVYWHDGLRKSEWVFASEIVNHADDPVVDAEVGDE